MCVGGGRWEVEVYYDISEGNPLFFLTQQKRDLYEIRYFCDGISNEVPYILSLSKRLINLIIIHKSEQSNSIEVNLIQSYYKRKKQNSILIVHKNGLKL